MVKSIFTSYRRESHIIVYSVIQINFIGELLSYLKKSVGKEEFIKMAMTNP